MVSPIHQGTSIPLKTSNCVTTNAYGFPLPLKNTSNIQVKNEEVLRTFSLCDFQKNLELVKT